LLALLPNETSAECSKSLLNDTSHSGFMFECDKSANDASARILHLSDQEVSLNNEILHGDDNIFSALSLIPKDTINCFPITYSRRYNSSLKSSETCSSSKSNLDDQFPRLPKRTRDEEDTGTGDIDDACACSSISIPNSSKDFCVNFLKTRGLLVEPVFPFRNSNKVSLGILKGNEVNFHCRCKVCGLILQNYRKILFCDLCEEAFHLSCFPQSKVMAKSGDNWYCQSCAKTNPRPLLDAVKGKIFPNISEEYKRKILRKELGPIPFMLVDTGPYTSNVRIGSCFQANVPECYGLSELNPLEICNVTDKNLTKFPKNLDSIGNWIQCRGTIYNERNDNDAGVLCGKWRRSPLFVTQTDNWDCFCSVVWDPFHSDCAVPQEIETDEVMKHLKFVDLLKNRFNKPNTKHLMERERARQKIGEQLDK